jgi:hypothetical protein
MSATFGDGYYRFDQGGTFDFSAEKEAENLVRVMQETHSNRIYTSGMQDLDTSQTLAALNELNQLIGIKGF